MQSASSAQAAQAGLVITMGSAIDAAWQYVDPTAPRQDLLTALIAAIVHKYSPASAALSARFYMKQRAAAGVTTPFRVKPAPAAPLDQIGATVGWATAPLRLDQPDAQVAQARLTGATERLVLNVGRQTIVDAVQADRKARGWARVTRPGACSFCRLLATRGAVYHSAHTAGSDFQFHDHCHCYVEPTFSVYEMTAQARSDLALYRSSTAGKSGAAARNAFRQAVADPSGTG